MGLLIRRMRWWLVFKKNSVKYAYQRGRYGYSDLDKWNLNTCITNIVPPVVRWMRDEGISYPHGMSFEEWQQVLTKIADGFEAAKRIYDYDYNSHVESMELEKTFNEGMRLFATHFHSLWD